MGSCVSRSPSTQPSPWKKTTTGNGPRPFGAKTRTGRSPAGPGIKRSSTAATGVETIPIRNSSAIWAGAAARISSTGTVPSGGASALRSSSSLTFGSSGILRPLSSCSRREASAQQQEPDRDAEEAEQAEKPAHAEEGQLPPRHPWQQEPGTGDHAAD